ncbi:hypothetical protein Agub_g9329 [Astrephomene gubernaculifera]|uniref:Uncharacterized protein n=1 Tax=Astrephomene gubernaculifera TaxID=47775 RepID=A0AAD3DT54_9CHLO|nr:hypothetical protein Agub_g9329 [Astrephomene gubernaculifera]
MPSIDSVDPNDGVKSADGSKAVGDIPASISNAPWPAARMDAGLIGLQPRLSSPATYAPQSPVTLGPLRVVSRSSSQTNGFNGSDGRPTLDSRVGTRSTNVRRSHPLTDSESSDSFRGGRMSNLGSDSYGGSGARFSNNLGSEPFAGAESSSRFSTLANEYLSGGGSGGGGSGRFGGPSNEALAGGSCLSGTAGRHPRGGVQFAGDSANDDSDSGGSGCARDSKTSLLELPALPSLSTSAGGAAAAAGGSSRAGGASGAAGPPGLTLSFLESLRSVSKPGSTLRDVFRTTVLPATKSARCAYVNLVGGEHRARPTHVLVCSWDELVSDVVEQVADFAASLGSPGGGGGSGVSSGGSSGSAAGGGSFAVWVDLFAINFHAAPPPMAPATAAAAASAALGLAGLSGASKPSTPPMDPSSQERARALPAAIAAIRCVLLLPGAQGGALREHPCTLAVWHALRGRGGAGGSALSVVAPPDLDVGLVQAAFEGLSVSTKAAEDPGSSNNVALGSGGDASSSDGATRMSPDRFTMRAMRDGVAAAATTAVTFAADPQPSRTVREGLTAAVAAAANVLLTRPVGYGTGVASGGSGGLGAGMSPRHPPSLPSAQQQQQPPAQARTSQGYMSDSAGFQSASPQAARWPPTMPSGPSPLRGSMGSSSHRALMLAGVDSWPAAQPPAATSAAGTTTAAAASGSPNAARLSSVSVPGEDDLPLPAAMSTSAAGATADVSMRGARAARSTGGGTWGMVPAPPPPSGASYDGGDGAGNRRLRPLGPLADGVAATAVATIESPTAASGGMSFRQHQQQQLRIKAPAPWETNAPLPSPGRAPPGATQGSGPLTFQPEASAAAASAPIGTAASADQALPGTSPLLPPPLVGSLSSGDRYLSQPLPPLTAPPPSLPQLPDGAPTTPQPQPPSEALPMRQFRGPPRPHALRVARRSGGQHGAPRSSGGAVVVSAVTAFAATAGEDADSETSDPDSDGPGPFLGAFDNSMSEPNPGSGMRVSGFGDSGGAIVAVQFTAGPDAAYRRLAPDLARLVGAAKLLAAMGQNATAMRIVHHAVAASRSLYGAVHPDTARCTIALVGLMLHVQQQQQQQQQALHGHHHSHIHLHMLSLPPRVGGGSSGSGALPTAVASSGGGGGSTGGSSGTLPLLPAGTPIRLSTDLTTLPPGAPGAGPTAPPLLPGDDPEALMRGALTVLERHLGPDAEEVAAARQGLAAVLAAAGRHEEAVPLLQRSVAGPAGGPSGRGAQPGQSGQGQGQRGMGSAVALAAALDLATSLAATGREREARKVLKAQLQRLQEEEDEAAALTAAASISNMRGRSSSHSLAAAAAATASPASRMMMPPASHQQQQQQQYKGSESPFSSYSSPYGGTLGSASPAGTPPVGSPAMSVAAGGGAAAAAGGASRGMLTPMKLEELQARGSLQLAQLKAAAGKEGAARGLYRRAVEGFSVVYGARHPITAACILGLAAVHHSLREYGEARTLYRTVLDLYLELHGPHHPATTRVSNQLGEVEEAMEEEACAEEEEEQSAAAADRGSNGRGGAR